MTGYKSYSFALLMLLLSACGEKEERQMPDDSDRLFSSTLRLIAQYEDSVAAATDSVQLQAMFTRFNSRLDSVNFAVAPDTDLLLTEGENDTIFARLSRLRMNVDKKLSDFARRNIQPADNIETPEE